MKLPPLPRAPEASWMIDDDGAQHPTVCMPTFSTDEMLAYARTCVKAALEEAAKVCEQWNATHPERLAVEIRKLIAKSNERRSD